jgi:hypothetical protein
MWAHDVELVKAVADQLAKLLRPQAPKSDDYEPEPPPPKPLPHMKLKPGTQEWFRSLPKPTRKPGDITMNELARRVPKARPPRKPGQQRWRFNGLWRY